MSVHLPVVGDATAPGAAPRPRPLPVPELSTVLATSNSIGAVIEPDRVVLADPPGAGNAGSVLRDTLLLGVVLGGSVALGYGISSPGRSLVHNRMLPWILGRSLGVAAYLTLTALVLLGLWLRHPWRTRAWSPRPESLLRGHVVLAASTVALLAGHVTSIALDRYAGVGWTGVLVPGQAHYRPTAVAFGTVALYALVLVGGTAALAGVIGRRVWFPIHTLSASVFCLCVVHGVLAGSDSHALRWMYVATGVVVMAVQITRWSVRYANRHPELEFE